MLIDATKGRVGNRAAFLLDGRLPILASFALLRGGVGLWICAVVAMVTFLATLSFGGCTPASLWDQHLVKGPEAPTSPLAEGDPIVVRDVVWERVQTTLDEIRGIAAASDVHPSEWDAAQQREVKGKLLRGLQVSQAPESVLVLGSSQFRTTEPLTNREQSLSRIARDLGANMVVYSTRVLGKSDRVVREPVSTTTTGTAWLRDSDDRRRPETYSETSTSWVPIRVAADEVGAVAYFLRVQP